MSGVLNMVSFLCYNFDISGCKVWVISGVIWRFFPWRFYLSCRGNFIVYLIYILTFFKTGKRWIFLSTMIKLPIWILIYVYVNTASFITNSSYYRYTSSNQHAIISYLNKKIPRMRRSQEGLKRDTRSEMRHQKCPYVGRNSIELNTN